MKWFNSQPLWLKLVLLLVPGLNWITEIFVRISAVAQKPTVGNILGVIFGLFIPVIAGWIDLLCVIITGHLLLAN